MIQAGIAKWRSGASIRTRRGFSLLELLVAVGIIAILAGITAASVMRIRERLRIVTCQGPLRTLVTGMLAYGSDGGSLPPGPVERAYWSGDPDRGTPYEPYDRRRADDVSLSSQEGWYGLGLLWKNSYVHDGGAYYCPAAKRKGGITPAQAWPRAFDGSRNPADDGTSRIFSTYAYRGGLSSHSGKPDGPLNLNRDPSGLATVADNPCSGRMWHDGGYNVAYLDGHVAFADFDSPPVTAGRLKGLWEAIDAYWED